MSKTWYEIKAAANTAEVQIYDEIGGWGITAKQFIKDFNNIKAKNITLRINSPGGSVWDGNAIYNAIKRFDGNVSVKIDGLAASMASVIALAGSSVEMADNAFMMIHNPWSFSIGDAEAMRKDADLLDKIAKNMVAIYAAKTGLSDTEVTDMMSEETWMTAQEAIDFGFVDSSYQGLEAAASFDLNKYQFKHVPETFNKAGGDKTVDPALAITPSLELSEEQKAAIGELVAAKIKDSPDGDNIAAEAVVEQEESIMTGKTVPGSAPEGADATAIANAEKAAHAASHERLSGIYAAFEPFGDKYRALMDECVKDASVTVDMAKTKLLNKIGEGVEPVSGDSITVGVSDREKFVQAAAANIEVRSGIRQRTAEDGQNQFMSYTLLELARQCLIINGKTPSGGKMDIVAQAFTTTSDFTNLLANTANKSMLRGWEESPETYQNFTRKGSLSDFKVTDRTAMSLFSDLGEVPENGEFKMGTFTDVKEQIQLLTYGKLFGISRQAIINDDLDAFSAIPRRMGRAARRKVGDLAYAVLTANAAMSDGVALFHANHSNLGTSGVLSVTTISEAKKLASLQTDPSGNGILNIPLKYLIVPRAIEDTAKTLMAAEYNPAEGSTTSFRSPNIHRNTLEVISDGRLDTSSAAVYYLAGDPEMFDTIEVAFLDGVDAPFLDQKTGWNVDGVEFKVRIDAAAKALDYRAMVKNAGT